MTSPIHWKRDGTGKLCSTVDGVRLEREQNDGKVWLDAPGGPAPGITLWCVTEKQVAVAARVLAALATELRGME